MDYLDRGGRAALLMPVVKRVARAFNIKPMINVVDGELTLRSAARSHVKGIQRLLEEASALAPFEKLATLHIQRPDAAVKLGDQLAQALGYPREDLDMGEIGAALSCHGGPGLTAFVGITKAAD
jgi:fatty acid-binding protein DegV